MRTPDTPVRLIVGLGNPGPEYRGTRHNVGQDFTLRLCETYSGTLTPNAKFFGLHGCIIVSGKDLRLLVPTTFMNRSGQAVAAVSNFYKIPLPSILIVHDELDLPAGSARLKIGGGHGGHNGLRDINSAFGNNSEYGRLRLGIGHPGSAKKVSSYVLNRASKDDRECIDSAIESALSYIPQLLRGDWEAAMRELHSKKN